MKVIIFTYDRYDTITTPRFFANEGLDHIVLCHSDDARQRYIDAGTVHPDHIIATGQPKGLGNNRNYALDMLEQDEWALFLVDDLRSLTEVADYDSRHGPTLGINMDNQAEFRGTTLKQPITTARFMRHAHELQHVCEHLGARLGGFCGIDNPPFRDSKWRFNVLADGRAWIVQKSSLRFDLNAQMVDDVCWTALNIQRFGLVVVNQWALPDCRRYTAGAYGSIEQRLEQKHREVTHLTSTYPSLIRPAKKAGWPDGTHCTLRRTLDNRQLTEYTSAALTASHHYRTTHP